MTTPFLDEAEQDHALSDALVADHLFGCDQNTCDIRMAYELGYLYYAANLLESATETPATDAVLARITGWRAQASQELDLFAPWFETHTVECPGCNSRVQFEPKSPRTMVTCANCLTIIALPARA